MKSEILLVAAVSRLIDLHDSKRERGTASKVIHDPQSSPRNAAYHMTLGLSILDALQSLEQIEGDMYQPKSRIVEEVKSQYPFVDEIDIDFCIRMLCGWREIHYQSSDVEKDHVTKETTPLIEKAVGEYSQFRLTENSRIFFRVNALKNSWLYEDKDTEKIVRAIESGHFDDVSRFCWERINSLLSLAKTITKAEESSLIDASVRQFLDSYETCQDSMSRSLEVVRKAMALLRSDVVFKQKFDEWQENTGRTDISVGNILSDLESVAKILEKINRRITNFIANAKMERGSTVEVISFLDIAESVAMFPPNNEIMESFFLAAGPGVVLSSFFTPFDFTDSIDLSGYGAEDQKEPREIDIESMVSESHERLSGFLERNRRWIIDLLRKGPMHFEDFLSAGEFILEPGETPADFYGIYAVPDELGTNELILVGTDGKKLEYNSDGVCMHGDDPILFLREN